MTTFAIDIDMPPDSLILPAPAGVDRDIPTDHGDGVIRVMKESELHRRLGLHDDADETAVWVEYRLGDKNGPVVHRSARVHLKKAVVGAALAAALG